jgi:hypothetical protein
MCSGERTPHQIVVSDYRTVDLVIDFGGEVLSGHETSTPSTDAGRFRLCLTGGEEISITPSAGSMFRPVLFARYRG